MTPEQAAAFAKPGVLGLTDAFAESPQTLRRARLMGLSGWAYHVAARAGALGDVRPDTVAAALGFIAPEAVTDGWEAAAKLVRPAEVAEWHLHELCRWGVDQVGPFPRVDRLAELLQRVVGAAEAAALPLFAAWRAMPVPDDAPGARVAVALHLLRELRSGATVVAIRAAGLSPLEAIIAGPDGETGAVAFGWQPPYPPLGPLVRRQVWADAITDAMCGQAFAALDGAERVELVGLLNSLLGRLGRRVA
ncbi:SCO6745 family protein [Spirilliplanes yamanashiensis]|uniref:Uncharacterized protein n=1 Tax=Spirilliplanes yamanashiensis TaxID=42233 RepID=A0A8J3Y3I6_9ACTN|nr:hypothetical protein [Spirilliplanes yamanashiensis]MDP9814156.1 hypothetical protein [Spirilliplanes yamanashiensis]GIJ00862.1 hypothetical protein Sya03_02140 [Spirilliplanes yamanashiensis]